ncbi:MAG TPA: hypothetical protein VFC14_12710 [Burkholderiales bacterium]|nr:hypothetical protein [Burkholderiales bacterium]
MSGGRGTYRAALASGLFAASLLATGPVHGQYPVKPVRFIVPFPAGGLADLVGRICAAPLTQALGQQIIDAPTTLDLIGGRLQMAFMATVPDYQQAKDGKLRIVATLVKTQLEAWRRAVREAGIPQD